MKTNFKEWMADRLLAENQQGNPALQNLFRSIAEAVRAYAHKDPFFSHLANSPDEMQEFLMSFYHLKLPKEQIEFAITSPQGMNVLIKRMVQDYMSRSPQVSQDGMKQAYDQRWGVGNKQVGQGQALHPAHTPAGRKILELAIRMAKQFGQDHTPYLKGITQVMEKNGQAKVDQWATQINTPEELHQKLLDWKKRGIL